MSVRGGYAHATPCACVCACSLCGGSNIIIAEGMSKICFDPNPRLIINKINEVMLPARFMQSTFENFTNFTGNVRQKVKFLRQWLKDFSPASKGLVLSGMVGLGKTHLLIAIAKELVESNVSVKFVDFFQLLSHLKDGFTRMQSEASVLQPLIDVDVLIIDELGKGRNTEWERCVLDQLIMGRYNSNKTIIASTNYLLHAPLQSERRKYNIHLDEQDALVDNFKVRELERMVGSRTFSRLYQMTDFVELRGDDFRRKIE